MTWLHKAYEDEQMPYNGYTRGTCKDRIMGCFQHLSGEEADKFLSTLQRKLDMWGAKCTTVNKSAGAVIRTSISGRGQLSLATVIVSRILHEMLA